MENTDSHGYVSVIATSFIPPILRLAEALESCAPSEPNEVQADLFENGYSCGIIVLSVMLLESIQNRIHYMRKEDPNSSAALYFSTILDDPTLAQNLEEVFSIRNAIVHNHIWEASVYWDDQSKLRFATPPSLLNGYGRKKFRQVIASTGELSKHLNLNLFPPKIWRRDAYTVMGQIAFAMKRIEETNRTYVYLSPFPFVFQGRLQLFYDIVAQIAVP